MRRKKNGEKWDGPLQALSGNYGENIKNGNNTITWNVLNEREEFTGYWRFGIDNYISIKKNIRNLKITCGLASLAGLGLSGYLFLRSDEYYNQYQTATTNVVELREKVGQMFQYGVISLSCSSLLFIERTILAKKIKKAKRYL